MISTIIILIHKGVFPMLGEPLWSHVEIPQDFQEFPTEDRFPVVVSVERQAWRKER
jgi:hypothetical protein